MQIFVIFSLIADTYGYDSVQWILQNSETAKIHQEKTAILAWLHTHVSGNQCNFLSSLDVHNHKALESTFDQILTIVVEITNRGELKHQAYDLTQMGRTRASRCRQHGFHSACARKDFYHKVNCHITFKEPLKVHTLTHTLDNGDTIVTANSEYIDMVIEENENLYQLESMRNDSDIGKYFSFKICYQRYHHYYAYGFPWF